MTDRADERKAALIGGAGRRLLGALLSTVRFEMRGDPETFALERAGRAIVYSLWHGRLLPLTWYYRRQGIGALISLSKDGEYIARVVQGWGYHVVRGSTSRGGSRALAQMIRLAKRGHSLAITPDGPRGPRERIKPGVLVAAQRSGAPLVPISAACSRAWWFEGWDRFLVPKPFSRIVIEHGAPMTIPPDADEAELERLALDLETRMNTIQRRLDAELGGGGAGDADGHVGDAVRTEDA